MSIEVVREYLKTFGKDGDIQEFTESSATVELAAQRLGVEPARIAKSISLYGDAPGRGILVITAGDAKIDNGKFREQFSCKAKMLKPEDVLTYTGHAVGGVCPFVNPDTLAVYADVSMRRFSTVFPACGSANSAIEMTCDTLFKIAKALEWVDVCKLPLNSENDVVNI